MVVPTHVVVILSYVMFEPIGPRWVPLMMQNQFMGKFLGGERSWVGSRVGAWRSERFGAFVQNADVGLVGKNLASLASADFLDDTQFR